MPDTFFNELKWTLAKHPLFKLPAGLFLLSCASLISGPFIGLTTHSPDLTAEIMGGSVLGMGASGIMVGVYYIYESSKERDPLETVTYRDPDAPVPDAPDLELSECSTGVPIPPLLASSAPSRRTSESQCDNLPEKIEPLKIASTAQSEDGDSPTHNHTNSP